MYTKRPKYELNIDTVLTLPRELKRIKEPKNNLTAGKNVRTMSEKLTN